MRFCYGILVAIACCLAVKAYVTQGQVPQGCTVANYGLGQHSATEDFIAPNGKASTLVVYSAVWCGPCQAMKPTLLQLKREGYNIAILDIDKVRSGEQVDQYKVKATRSVPETVWLNDGKVVRRATGIQLRSEILKTLVKPDGEPNDTVPDRKLINRSVDYLFIDDRRDNRIDSKSTIYPSCFTLSLLHDLVDLGLNRPFPNSFRHRNRCEHWRHANSLEYREF